MRLTRDFYRPSASLNAVKDTSPDVPGSEIYRYTKEGGTPVALVFGGKRSKPDFWFRFPTEEAREKRIAEWVEDQKSRAEYAAKRRASANAGHTLKVGDVLHASWGYDQTNANFYQVVEVPSKCFVIAREIGSEIGSEIVDGSGGPSTQVRPVKDAFLSDERGGAPKRYKSGPDNSIAAYSFANAHKTSWEETHYETGFGYGH